jgi:acetyltransferase-like isoleucine patch superfamily enzyme
MNDDILTRFKACGRNVQVADDAYIEHPECIEVGDDVTFGRGFHMIGKPGECRFGSDVTFYNNCFIQGSPGFFILEDHVQFYPGTYISLGEHDTSGVEVCHHSHFAPYCVLYGWGGLRIGPYCNIAAHTVFATVGHREEITDRPMALTGEKHGPITLEEDVWIAANVTITANTTIAKGCVIGANAVVTHDTEPMGLYAGVPARRLRDRGETRKDPEGHTI